MHRPPKLPSSTVLRSQNSKTREQTRTSNTIFTETYYSQPKLQNKRLKYIRPATKSSFFYHLQSTKIIEAEQLMDQSFVSFLDNLQKHKGFKGAKTHSWNQLMYLTPQKRHKSSTQELKDVQKELYTIIKPETNNEGEKTPVRTTLIEFLTEYNPKKNQNMESAEKVQHSRCQRKTSNIIREKLRNHQKKSEYKNKMHNYQLLFQGFKIP